MVALKNYAALCGFAAVTSAHMKLANPKPFAGTESSPLDPSGSNFPCQNKVSTGESTTYTLGAEVEMAFTGQAVHGGGSCQISISYDASPTKSSVWKVLHSIQGGCPAVGQSGNMGDSPSADDPFKYKFTIPSNLPAGTATIAWTWLNRIGNREYYMNCAPITLTGSGGSKSNFEALPDMLVVNIPSINSCSTSGLEGSDYIYPNPGSSVESKPFSASSLVKLNGNCGTTVASGSGSSSGSSGSDSGASPSKASSAAPASSKQPTATIPGGVFITVGSSATASAVASESPKASSKSSAAPPAASASPAASSGGSSSGSSGSSGSSSGSSSTTSVGAQTVGSVCTDGEWNCVGGSSFQRCGSGFWGPVQALAAGTKCSGGVGANINIVNANGKVRRVARRFRS